MFDSDTRSRYSLAALPQPPGRASRRGFEIIPVSQVETFRDLGVALAGCLCAAAAGSLLAALF